MENNRTQSKWLASNGDQQLVGYSNIIETVAKEYNSEKEKEMETAVSESQPPHVTGNLKAIPIQITMGTIVILSSNQFLTRTLTRKLI